MKYNHTELVELYEMNKEDLVFKLYDLQKEKEDLIRRIERISRELKETQFSLSNIGRICWI